MATVGVLACITIAVLGLEILHIRLAAGDAGCTAQSDLGQTECVLLSPYYSLYQWGTCVTADYVLRASAAQGKPAHCRDARVTQCYYQCMVEVHYLGSGPVYDDCRCSPGVTVVPPTQSLPPQCFSPTGSDCQWYRQCLGKRYDCSGTGYDYAIGYGKKFCELYGSRYSEFSPLAQSWIDATRKCLQVKLVPFLRPWVKATCKDIYTEAFRTHTGCYLTPQTGAPSFCQLSCSELWKLFWLVSYEGNALFLEPIETASQMFSVAAECRHQNDISFCSRLLFQSGYYFLKVPLKTVQLYKLGKELGVRIVQAIAMRFEWQKDGLRWIPLIETENPQSNRQQRSVLDETNPEGLSNSLQVKLLLVNSDDLNITNTTRSTEPKTVQQAIDELSSSVRKGELSHLTVVVNGTSVTTGVSTIGQCLDAGCNETESVVLATAPSSARLANGSIWLVLPVFGFLVRLAVSQIS